MKLIMIWMFCCICVIEMAGVPARKSPSTVPIMSRDCTAGEGLSTTGPPEPLQCLDPTMGSTRLWANSARPSSPPTSIEKSLLSVSTTRSPSCEQPIAYVEDVEPSHHSWEYNQAPFIVTDHCQMPAAATRDSHGTLSRKAELSEVSEEVDHNPYQITEL